MKKLFFILIITSLTLTSCTTYYMSSTSLKEQLHNINPNKINDAYDFRLGLLGVALKGGKNFYNGIDKIQVTDKNGNTVERLVTTNTSIRLTDTKGKRVQLYFDSIFLRDSLVYGSKSHFITLPVIPMNIDSLVKIEVQ
ncbi:hypothetical protein VB264_22675 [Arcicella aquatica]|uniref:Lipoprotein n=1 Tax=Arcicella aquatica TaxID=217141 RepID=A0ABU5QV87_9BACT|nr:hypothetical protein [Arcicella aquatica]MEA5260620.1 hypothetical protein [Arcicella aquatica]